MNDLRKLYAWPTFKWSTFTMHCGPGAHAELLDANVCRLRPLWELNQLLSAAAGCIYLMLLNVVNVGEQDWDRFSVRDPPSETHCLLIVFALCWVIERKRYFRCLWWHRKRKRCGWSSGSSSDFLLGQFIGFVLSMNKNTLSGFDIQHSWNC